MLLTARTRRHALMLLALLPAWCAAAQAAVPAKAAIPAGKPEQAVRRVDVNTASRAELKTLPGVGDAEADRIVSLRPYLSKAELATKGALPTGTYLSLRRAVEAKPPRPAHR
jgi:DNA uptake protein ComE-like DNA-binding protein